MSDHIVQNVSITGDGNIVVGKGNVVINPIPPAESRLRHHLGILLKNVQTTWIDGVLRKSIHDTALLELGMEVRVDAVDNPWRMVIEGPDQSREILPPGTKIKDIFNDASRLLLILGEPGSGKTTTLLQLARDLIEEVDQAFTEPIPVILNLSTWTNKQQPLDEWLVGEMNSKYRLPKKDGRNWLRDRRLLPLLDGLDEVKAENRAACVEKINQLVIDFGLQGLVVCSRLREYTDLNTRLAFYRAIYLQPLTTEQVREYLERAGDKLTSLRTTLEGDESLQNMARSPLILSVMSLAYQNTSAETLSDPTATTDKARYRLLFDTYVDRMFSRRVGMQKYSNKETKKYLSWLASNMQKHNQDIFLIEGLQPSCLQVPYLQRLYVVASRMFIALIIGLSFAWAMDGIGDTLIFVIVLGLPVAFVDILRFEWLRQRKGKRQIRGWSVINVVVVWLSVFLSVWFVGDFLNALGLGSGTIGGGDGLFTGLFVGLFAGVRGSKQSLEHDIQTVEALHWSWKKALRGELLWGCTALAIILIPLLFTVEDIGLIDRLKAVTPGLILAALIGLIGAIFSGLRPEIIETKSAPNQGIRLSIRNASFTGLIICLFFAIGFGLFGWLNYEVFGNAREGLGLFGGVFVGVVLAFVFGLFLGLMGFLWYGGFDVIQHYALRLILTVHGHTPWKYSRFLDYAADRTFLQKVGGGYRFIHRLLLEHFADMELQDRKSS